MARPRPRFQKFSWRQKLSLILSSVVLGILIFEFATPFLPIDFNLNPIWRYHPILGWSQTPNFRDDYYVENKLVHVEFNSKGFRDVEHAVQKPPRTRRIVVIGDSLCEAVQVNLKQTFFKLLEKRLNQSNQGPWEVINLGVGDFGTAQEWIALNAYGFSYSPDIVIGVIFPLNDICNNSIELYELCNSNNDRYRPYFVVKKNQLVLTSAQPIRNFLRRHLISYGILERIWLKSSLAQTREKQDELRERRLGEKGYPILDPLLFTYASDSEQVKSISKGWQITEMILQKILNDCRKRRIPFIPVVVPFEGCVGDLNWRAFSSILRGPRLTPDYPEVRLDRFFTKNRVPAVILKPSFDAAADSVLPYLDGHLNLAGHQIMADAIFSKLLEQRLLK